MKLQAWLAPLALTACFAPSSGLAADGEIPTGWHKAGSKPDEYDMGLDVNVRHEGRASAYVRCNTSTPTGFGTLMQSSDAAEYRGKRVRFSGHVKSEKVDKGWAGLWLRIDGPQDSPRPNVPLAFDNMQDRAIKGTTDWKQYEIVLDVAPEAATLNFGILLGGDGQVWMDSLSFEAVTSSVPVTTKPRTPPLPPQNLAFDKALDPLGTLRTIMSAQAYYKKTKPAQGHACEFAPLVSARALSDSRTWNQAMDGYIYTIECPKKEMPQATYRAAAVPAAPGTGPVYCTKDGTVILKGQGSASACFEKGEPLK